MAETAHFRGEGGHVWEMDLPLSEQHARAEQEGRLVRVNQDGSAFSESAEESEAPSTEPASEPGPQEPPKKPNKASSKADWVAWAVQHGAEQEEAESLTLAALIERFHSAE
ncbi:hypothetical protein ABZV15_07975 [Streptomyces sp. NPDC005246]|uniref:hypothetical protein n=1 Tax=Streptomyces sp. NPDC005246 TaxID=3156716 RepID=UPI0033A59461